MEFKRKSVISLYLAGTSVPDIVRQLQHLNINKMFAYRTIERYKVTGSIAKRNNGGPKRTATSRKMVRKVKVLIEQNPKLSARKLAKALDVSDWSIRQILKNIVREDLQQYWLLKDKQKLEDRCDTNSKNGDVSSKSKSESISVSEQMQTDCSLLNEPIHANNTPTERDPKSNFPTEKQSQNDSKPEKLKSRRVEFSTKQDSCSLNENSDSEYER